MDRRNFLKTTGLGLAAVGLAACAHKQVNASAQSAPKSLDGSMKQNFEGVGLLGYGCMRWPMVKDENGRDRIDQAEVNRLVDFAMEHGVNYYDTSPAYLQGDSERATSEALNRYPRESWLLATKASNFSDWGYENSIKMYRRSMEIFKTDYIDYYLLHSVGDGRTFQTRFGETGLIDFLVKERAAGHIRNLGFSFHGSNEGLLEMMALHDKYHWDFVQIQMNYLDWKQAGNASFLYEELTKRNIPVVIMEPLRGGALATMPAALSDMLKEREPAKSLASWAFRFAGSFPNVKCVLSGMTYMDHLEDNLDTYLDFKPLNDEEMELLEDVAVRMRSYPLVSCTGCQYCMPCPYGINIPGIFSFYNNSVNEGTYVTNKDQEHYSQVRRKFLAEYNKNIPAVRQADHCISCGKCVSACPQHIRIPRELQRIDKYIESVKREEY